MLFHFCDETSNRSLRPGGCIITAVEQILPFVLEECTILTGHMVLAHNRLYLILAYLRHYSITKRSEHIQLILSNEYTVVCPFIKYTI